MNPYLFEMVNIRDQCSWVHMGQRDIATSKAKDLVRMGVAKSISLEPADNIESSVVHKTLVIGGGIAGLSVSESLAAMGLEVILVEKAGKLGGLMRSLHVLDSGAAAEEQVDKLADKVINTENITIHVGSEVTEITGYIGNFVVTIKKGDGVDTGDRWLYRCCCWRRAAC